MLLCTSAPICSMRLGGGLPPASMLASTLCITMKRIGHFPTSFDMLARVPAIFGRDRELGAVEAAVRRGLAGQGALLLLSGEPGIGKTLLAEHAATVAAQAGAAAAWGRCWEAGGAPAYWPWIQAFRG